MRIAVSTVHGSPVDPKVWSGTSAHAIAALQRRADVSPVGPLKPNLIGAFTAGSRLARAVGDGSLRWEVEPSILRRLTRAAETDARRAGAEVCLAMGWLPIEPSGEIPWAMWHDATIAQRVGVAPYWTGVSDRTKRNVRRAEGASLAQVTPIYSSDWASSAAKSTYGVHAFTVPFGANIADPGPITREKPNQRPIRVLMVGVEWHRKGFDIAIQTIDELSKQRDIHLDAVGICPPSSDWIRPHVTWHGRVEKSALADLYRSADLFLLPTRDEPFGVVFGEAAAFGLPVVSCNLGNVPERVIHGTTGVLVAPSGNVHTWSQAIEQVLEMYPSMTQAARAEYLKNWQWNTTIDRLLPILHSLQSN